jgi:(p)ppGpp synthase/HD superfamily hydrolase
MNAIPIIETIRFVDTSFKGLYYGKRPYVDHLLLVAAAYCDTFGVGSISHHIYTEVALLHDILEDTETTKDDLLRLGYSEYVVESVVNLTNVGYETYESYMKNLLDNGTVAAKLVKFADSLINYNASNGLITGVDPKVDKRDKYYRNMDKIAENFSFKSPRDFVKNHILAMKIMYDYEAFSACKEPEKV